MVLTESSHGSDTIDNSGAKNDQVQSIHASNRDKKNVVNEETDTLLTDD